MLRTLRNATHLARTAAVLARYDALWPAQALEKPAWLDAAGAFARLLPLGRAAPRTAQAEDAPRRFAAALQALGPAYIKLGQILATRPDVVGPAVASALTSLQDRLPPFAQEQAEAAVADAFAKPAGEVYERFGAPVAAASIAQVHQAQIAAWIGHNRAPANDDAPRTVAVKILRPGIEAAFQRDLESFFFAARFIERHIPASRRLEPVKLVQTLRDSVALELDLRLEAAAATEMARNTAQDPHFRVPRIDWARTARRVLTLEWIDGTPIGDREALIAKGHDMRALATRVMQSFLTHALRDGFFHADMHQGNLFVDEAGHIVAVDFGIMGRLDAASRRYLAEILYGFLTRDYARIAAVHFEAGYVPGHYKAEAFAQALRAIGEPIFGRHAGEISMARLFAQLFETTALFDMHLRPELVLLQKTMVAVEGVARHLDGEHNLWDAARPIVERFMAKELGPEARLHGAAESAAELGRVAAGLPAFLKTMERAAALYVERGAAADGRALAAARARARRAERAAFFLAGLLAAALGLWIMGAP